MNMSDFEDPTARKVLVCCRDASGVHTLYPAVVYVTDSEFEDGYHYQKAERQARSDGYELLPKGRFCIDEQDAELTGQTELFEAIGDWEDKSPAPNAFLITDGDEIAKAKADPDRVVARYVKQEKVRPSGRIQYVDEEYWDVTAVIDEMDREEVLQLRDHDYSTDSIVHDYSDHEGPHEVEVVQQALEYIDATGEEVEST